MSAPISMRIAVPNSIFFVRDSSVRKYPDIDDERASFWSTSTCVMIQCLPDCEGPTDVTVGTAGQVEQPRRPAFDKVLQTPSRRLLGEIVPGDAVFAIDVPGNETRVRVWTDGRHQCAQTVVIGIG